MSGSGSCATSGSFRRRIDERPRGPLHQRERYRGNTQPALTTRRGYDAWASREIAPSNVRATLDLRGKRLPRHRTMIVTSRGRHGSRTMRLPGNSAAYKGRGGGPPAPAPDNSNRRCAVQEGRAASRRLSEGASLLRAGAGARGSAASRRPRRERDAVAPTLSHYRQSTLRPVRVVSGGPRIAPTAFSGGQSALQRRPPPD